MNTELLPPHAGKNPLHGTFLAAGFIVFGLVYLLLVILSAPLRLIGWIWGYR